MFLHGCVSTSGTLRGRAPDGGAVSVSTANFPSDNDDDDMRLKMCPE
jgi:hypothetical protein